MKLKVLVYNPLFDLKIVYSYVVEVAYYESNLGLHGKILISEILAFTTFWNMHEVDQDVVVMYTLVNFFFAVFDSYKFMRVLRVFEGF